MKFKIFFEVNGYEYSLEIEGKTIDDIHAYALVYLDRRNATYVGSELIEE